VRGHEEVTCSRVVLMSEACLETLSSPPVFPQAPATSGRRRLLAPSPTVSYDVGGAQHVAVNLTIRAMDNLIQPIQKTLNESIRGGRFLQTVNNTGIFVMTRGSP